MHGIGGIATKYYGNHPIMPPQIIAHLQHWKLLDDAEALHEFLQVFSEILNDEKLSKKVTHYLEATGGGG